MARQLEGRPFHLILSHCHDVSSRDKIKLHLQAHGMLSFQQNLTVTKDGDYPGVAGKLNKEGIRLLPHYFVFHPTGRLVTHNLGGPYHGGDHWTMIDVFDELLAGMPAIYLGPEPFQHIEKLAAQVSQGKHVGDVTKTIDHRLAAEPDAATKSELERLLSLITRHRDRRLRLVTGLEASDPRRVGPELKALAKEFKGTTLVKPIATQVAAASASKALAAAIDLQKRFLKIQRRFESVKPKKRTDCLTRCRSTARRREGYFDISSPTTNRCRSSYTGFSRTLAKAAMSRSRFL